jgi:signal transduction histidine kinase
MAADAKTMGRNYLDRMNKTVWPVIQRYWFDALIVLAALGGVLEIVLDRDAQDAPSLPLALALPLEAGLTLILLTRRRFPFAAPAGTLIAGAVLSFVDGSLVTFSFAGFLAALAAAFLLAMLPDRRQAVIGLAVTLAAILVVMGNDPHRSSGDVFLTPLVFLAVWLAGFGLGRKLEQAQAAEERAARIERQREDEARAAVAEERARIARELHDVVGHSVSVMTVQASGVRRLLKPDQDREREALLVVEQAGREALAEMRRLVGILRRPEEAPALAPQPSLQHLERLVEQARDAGLPVDVQIEGEATELPAGIDLTAYRLVQEGLTNAIKHAKATRAEVIVRYGPDKLELVVSDDGRGFSHGSADGGGHGLVGMRERVAVYGGELEAGAKPDGGYALHARLPLV